MYRLQKRSHTSLNNPFSFPISHTSSKMIFIGRKRVSHIFSEKDYQDLLIFSPACNRPNRCFHRYIPSGVHGPRGCRSPSFVCPPCDHRSRRATPHRRCLSRERLHRPVWRHPQRRGTCRNCPCCGPHGQNHGDDGDVGGESPIGPAREIGSRSASGRARSWGRESMSGDGTVSANRWTSSSDWTMGG